MTNIPDLDIYNMVEDILNFLKLYPSNPYKFIHKYLSFVFTAKDLYNNQALYCEIITYFLELCVFVK